MIVETTDGAIRIEVDLPLDRERVWTLLTEPSHVAAWWGSYATLDARPGGRLVERWSNGEREVVTDGVVTRYDPPRSLELTWADDDWPGPTTVAFRLSAGGSGTLLRLEHAGWQVHPPDARQELIDAHTGGWTAHLTSLTGYAERLGAQDTLTEAEREEGVMTTIDPNALPTQTFSWGAIKWFVTPDRTPGAAMTFGEVVLLPGRGHDRHNHPDAEEILYVLSGEGDQMVADGAPFRVRPGDTIYVPPAVFHSTINTGWEPLRLLAIYNPGGPERALATLPDFAEAPAGALPTWTLSGKG